MKELNRADAASTRWIASSFEMSPSFAISTAVRTAARLVRFAERH